MDLFDLKYLSGGCSKHYLYCNNNNKPCLNVFIAYIYIHNVILDDILI